MRVYIQVKGEEAAFPLVVECHDTIASVKLKIHMMIGVEPQHQKLTYADWELADEQTLVDANIHHRATIQASIPAEVPVGADAYESNEAGFSDSMDVEVGSPRPRRQLRSTHSVEVEPPAVRVRVGAPPPGDAETAAGTPSVDPNNALEVALQKFGLHTLSSKLTAQQEKFETYIKSYLDEQLEKQGHQYSQQQEQIKGLPEGYEVLKQIVEDLRRPDTSNIAASMKNEGAFPMSDSQATGPTKIRIRGWAPFGCSMDKIISKVEYKQRVTELKELLPASMQNQVRFESPFLTNHQILVRVIGGGERCWVVQEALQAKIDEKDYKICGQTVRVSVEPSQESKQWYRSYFASLRALESKVDASSFEPDIKALAIYAKPSQECVGKLNRKSSKFEWDEGVVSQLGTTSQALESEAM